MSTSLRRLSSCVTVPIASFLLESLRRESKMHRIIFAITLSNQALISDTSGTRIYFDKSPVTRLVFFIKSKAENQLKPQQHVSAPCGVRAQRLSCFVVRHRESLNLWLQVSQTLVRCITESWQCYGSGSLNIHRVLFDVFRLVPRCDVFCASLGVR